MYNEGAPEFVVNQGLYYPTASNYEYLCTAFESPGDWDDRHRFFGLDGHDIQYTGLPNESIPYVYYTPSYEYAQSTYNPYNPYIPGAMMGVDGPFAGAQQYYTIPSHENPVSSPMYIPMVVQSRPDADVNGTIDPFIDYTFVNRADGPALKHNLSTKSPIFSQTQLRNASSQTNSSTGVSKGTRENTGSSKQPMTHRSVTSRRFPLSAPSQSLQVGVAQTIENVPNGKALSNHSPLKVALPSWKRLVWLSSQ
ncbi:evolutionarily conserved C-terminal region 7 [Forsythia ovata]|uniref:Evolutionarily conserved C-terminal region 7 n=1 Tax=Forsythia ovata TaxID=205694 RepID=A0ABD1UT88_9LAMI